MRTLLLFAITLIFTIPAEAGNKGGKREPSEGQKKREMRKAIREKKKVLIKEYLQLTDLNGDGSISLDEYLLKDTEEGAEERFKEANKNGDRALTKTEISDMLGLDEKFEAEYEAKNEKKK